MKALQLILWAAALACGSCNFKPLDADMARTAAFLNPRREASLLIWEDKTLHGRPARDFASVVTAIVLPSHVRLTSEQRETAGVAIRYNMHFKTGKSLFWGSAVPIAADGYFLTAAHCLGNSPGCTLIAIAKGHTIKTLPARLFWRGGDSTHEPDLALIHAPVIPDTSIIMSPMESLRSRHPVLTGGAGSNGFPKLKVGQSGGRLVILGEIRTSVDGVKWRSFNHSAPLAQGDSGGPVIGKDGRLIGINTGMSARSLFPFGLNWIWGYYGCGEAADTVSIQSLIKEDRRRRKLR